MKRPRSKKVSLIVLTLVSIALFYIIITNFVFSANLGHFVGDVFQDIDTPSNETFINSFSETQINWEIAYWSAMISEFTYAKTSYPLYNRALSRLGFKTERFYSFFEFEGEPLDDLMVDVGVKDVSINNYQIDTLIVIAFRGSVPMALNSPTTAENMRRNMDFFSQRWRNTDQTVHRGFYSQYNDFISDILPEINKTFNLNILQDDFMSGQNLKFWITGHSMGAALAELLTLDLIENGIAPERIITYGFATPLVGSQRLQEHAQMIGASDRIFKIIHQQDMVGYIGYRFLFGASLAAENNIYEFGRRGIFNRSHHSLPRIYIPFTISKNDAPLRQQLETSLIVLDM